jgi:hypothetical protein
VRVSYVHPVRPIRTKEEKIMALHITDRETTILPSGNSAFWVTVTGPTGEYASAGRMAGAHARRVAARLGRGHRAYRLTSGTSWNYPHGQFQERVLYAFSLDGPGRTTR